MKHQSRVEQYKFPSMYLWTPVGDEIWLAVHPCSPDLYYKQTEQQPKKHIVQKLHCYFIALPLHCTTTSGHFTAANSLHCHLTALHCYFALHSHLNSQNCHFTELHWHFTVLHWYCTALHWHSHFAFLNCHFTAVPSLHFDQFTVTTLYFSTLLSLGRNTGDILRIWAHTMYNY